MISREKQEKMVKLHEKGLLVPQIAKKLRLSAESVRKYLKIAGIFKFNTRGEPGPSPATQRTIVDLYLTGYSAKIIARLVQRRYDQVVTILKRHEVFEPWSRRVSEDPRYKVSPRIAAQMREQGHTYQGIANKFGVSRQAVHFAIKIFNAKKKGGAS